MPACRWNWHACAHAPIHPTSLKPQTEKYITKKKREYASLLPKIWKSTLCTTAKFACFTSSWLQLSSDLKLGTGCDGLHKPNMSQDQTELTGRTFWKLVHRRNIWIYLTWTKKSPHNISVQMLLSMLWKLNALYITSLLHCGYKIRWFQSRKLSWALQCIQVLWCVYGFHM